MNDIRTAALATAVGGDIKVIRQIQTEHSDAIAQAQETATSGAQAASEADAKATAAKRAAGVTPYDFDAQGDGTADDRTAMLNAIAAPEPLSAVGEFRLSGLPAPSKTIAGRATLLRSATGNLMSGTATGAIIDGWTFDMNRAGLGNAAGHGLSLQGDDITIRNLTVRDFGSDGVGGGSGVLIYAQDGTPKAKRARLENLSIFADPNATQSFGWILANVDYSFVSGIYAQDVRGPSTSYAHELKNDAQFNSLS